MSRQYRDLKWRPNWAASMQTREKLSNLGFTVAGQHPTNQPSFKQGFILQMPWTDDRQLSFCKDSSHCFVNLMDVYDFPFVVRLNTQFAFKAITAVKHSHSADFK
jgi:hypothetical protein